MRMKKVIVFLGLAVAFSSMAMDKESSTAKLESNELSPATVTAPALPVEKKYVFNSFLEAAGLRINLSHLDNRPMEAYLAECSKIFKNYKPQEFVVQRAVFSKVVKTITIDSEGNVISESETVVDSENQNQE